MSIGSRLTIIALWLAAVPTSNLYAGEVVNRQPVCGFGDLRIDTDFPAGRISECAQTGKNEFTLGLEPENRPVNHSPWYAFRVMSAGKRKVTIYLHYGAHKHRYVPKVSRDGESWSLLDEKSWEVLLQGKLLKLRLQVGPEPLYVAGQELIDNRDYKRWIERLAEKPYVSKSLLGRSTEGRPIYKIESTGAEKPGQVVIVGRQHPPEVTGAIALIHFVERVWQEDMLAKKFRQKFNLLVVPNLNPDGVEHGHWRHNMEGLDLNRDWGPFTQIETRLMRDELDRFKEEGAPRLYLFLDFHSTNKDVFYTQLDEMRTFPENFTRNWLDAIQQRFPDYKVTRQPGHNPDLPTSKAYVNATFGIPALTYELGDETDRELIRITARGAAEEMMKLLLAEYE